MAEDTRGTIKVSRDTFERHSQRREQLGMTWDEYLDEAAPEVPTTEIDEQAIAEQITDDLLSQLPRRIADELH